MPPSSPLVDSLCELAPDLERLSHAHEVPCPSCGAQWPAARMALAGTVYGDRSRTVTYCTQSCPTMRWTPPMLDLVFDWVVHTVLTTEPGTCEAFEEVD